MFSLLKEVTSVKRHIFYALGADYTPDLTMTLGCMLGNIIAFIITFPNGTYPHETDFLCVVDIGRKSIKVHVTQSEAVIR